VRVLAPVPPDPTAKGVVKDEIVPPVIVAPLMLGAPPIVGDVKVLFVKVCVSVVPTKAPVGAVFDTSTECPDEGPIKTAPEGIAPKPVPPSGMYHIPLNEDILELSGFLPFYEKLMSLLIYQKTNLVKE
jgi:hypothetical protein